MSNNLMKSGYLHKFSKGLMGEKWKRVYCTLYRDGAFFWYKNKGDATSSGNVSLKNVGRFITVGANIRAIPYNPDLPPWGNIDYVIAFPQEPSKKSKVYFFLAEDDKDMTSWMTSINDVMPAAPQPSGGIAPNYGVAPQGAPPAYAPAPSYGAPTGAPPYGAPPAPSYGAPPGAPPYTNPQPSAPPPGAPPMGAAAPPPRAPGLGFDSVAMPQPGPVPYPVQPPLGTYQPPPPTHYPTQPAPNNYPPPPAGFAPPPAGQYAPPPPAQPGYQPYQQQPAYQQPQYPQQQSYPRQQYTAYPQQGYAAPAAQGYGQPVVYGQPATQTVYVKDKKSKNKGYKNMALGLAGGAVAGYAASRMFRPFGGFGWGHGSWGSGSWGSCSFGSCGSFGSFG